MIETMEEIKIGFYQIDEYGNMLGSENSDRLKSLPWYKRLWAKVNKKYRRKQIDIHPLKCSEFDFALNETRDE